MRTNCNFSTSLLQKRFTILMILLLGAFSALQASHNMAGQITYTKIGTNQYEITLTTYTDPSGGLVDRCKADFFIYDINDNLITEINDIPRQNGPLTDPLYPNLPCDLSPRPRAGEYIIGTIKKNIYRITYTFNGPGTFKIGYEDHARINGVVNMNNSDQTAFYVVTTIQNNPFLGTNDSPNFLNDPIDFACTNKRWEHNPGGYDPEGDSLVYTLIPCKKSHFLDVDAYRYPDQISPGANNSFSIDPQTGLITWDAPQQTGWYNVAFRVDEYRNGVKIGEAVRDMSILVNPCDNNPPVIDAPDEICIRAGETLEFDFKAWDPDVSDSLYFHLNNGNGGLNGPFSVTPNGADITFSNPPLANPTFPIAFRNLNGVDTIKGTVTWQTRCEDIRASFYQIDFYAHDNYGYFNSGGSNQMLSDHHVIKIYVIPPALTGLTATPGSRQVNLNWNPHACSNATGYKVFRRVGQSGWQQDPVCCEGQPEDAGYSLIAEVQGHSNTSFTDNNGNQGFNYGQDICYVVVACFPDGVRSCATNEACINVNKDYPVMTNDSVDITDPVNGAIMVAWSRPDTSVIDPGFNPPPYQYNLYRTDGIVGPGNYIQVNTSPLGLNDTIYFDVGLNTEVTGYRYYVEFLDQVGPVSESNIASSVFLTLQPGDMTMGLTWSEFTPWPNDYYLILRKDPGTATFIQIDSIQGTGANTHSYLDTGLINGEEYCYVVVSGGTYNSPNIKQIIKNASQEVCGIPVDLTPPCFSYEDTDTASDCENFTVTLYYDELDSLCGGDLDYLSVYIAPDPEGPWALLDTIQDRTGGEYVIQKDYTIAGCYAMTATDTVGNESDFVPYCVDNCPIMEPSNVFTPNGDGINDYFDPFRYRSVIVSEVIIFDRWGRQVWGLENANGELDPDRLWNGISDGGKQSQAGLYYYIIKYEEIRLGGNVKQEPLVGWVSLIR